MKDWLIVDGYSLLHRAPEFAGLLRRNLRAACEKLTARLACAAPLFAARATVVFDGRGETREVCAVLSSPSLEVLYSPADLTADSVIERLVYEADDPSGILVITSDRAERETVGARGADTMGCGDFLTEAARREADALRAGLRRSRSHRPPTVGDFFPKS